MGKMVKIALIIFLIFIFFVVGIELHRNKIESIIKGITSQIDKKQNLDKFVLNLQANYLSLIPIGRASFRLEGIYPYQGSWAYLLKLEAKDMVPLSWLKPAKAEMSAYVDTIEILPQRLSSHLDMDGRGKEYKEIIYNQKEGFMLSENDKYKILPQTRETLSLFFYLMKQNFSLNQVLDLNFNSNQANYRTKVEVKDKKKYLVQGKEYSVWELNISVRRRTGGMRHSFDAKAFFLENTNMQIPLLVKGSTNLGNILIRLEGIR